MGPTPKINKSGLTLRSNIRGDDEEDAKLLRDMACDAESYILSFNWCPPISKIYYACGVGGVAALFLFEFLHPISGTDKELWIVNGDVPSAYFVTDCALTPQNAMLKYCEIMEDWCDMVRNGTSPDDQFPVNAPRTSEYVEMLLSRIQFIRIHIIPLCE